MQAHQITWTTNKGCARALHFNIPNLSKEEVRDTPYSAKLHSLLEMYSLKQLMCAYPGICAEKSIHLATVDMDAAFEGSAKARKTISEACNNDVEINPVASNSSNEDR